MTKKLGLIVLGICVFLTEGRASSDVQKYEIYLNNLKTLEGTFTQVNSKGHKASGTVHIARPGGLRLTYNPPSSLLIIADGKWFMTYDKAEDETNYASLENTPAAFILRPRISFQEDVTITSIVPKGDITEISFVHTDDPDAGTLSLSFTQNPVTLKEWSVRDAQGIETRVTLSDIKSNISLSPDLFKVKDPSLIERIF
jgi:outer membrane lipoprotein-sorting protein